jgi:hypothetical protein
MKTQKARRYVFGTAVMASLLLSAVSALPQQRRIEGGHEVALPAREACPNPRAWTLNATTPNVFNADFNATQLGLPRAFLNDPAPNKAFLYTFQWRSDRRCCEITRAVLTVKMKANQGGTSLTSSDAGNDGITIMHSGSAVQGEAVYTPPFNSGQPSIKTWPLSGAALHNLKVNGRLSIYVQDDTMVESATLQISGCCLSEPPRDAVEEAQPIRREN